MQRNGCGDDDSPYINHGVLPNHSNLKSTTFTDRDTKDTRKTEPAHSYPEKERLFANEEVSRSEAVRQNLAREFPAHKRQGTFRPGSPAEKEKHRIHNVDLDELLGVKSVHAQIRLGKPGDFRKALSSTCVSACPKTANVQCQTSDDLVEYLLPPLRKRCVSKSKNKLERSSAVDDLPVSSHRPKESGPTFKCTTRKHSLNLRSISPLSIEDLHNSPSKTRERTHVVICPSWDQVGLSSLPELDSHEPSLIVTSAQNHKQRRHSHNTSHSHCQQHRTDRHRRCSNDSTSLLSNPPRAHSHQDFGSEVKTPLRFLGFNTNECFPEQESCISPRSYDQFSSVSGNESRIHADTDAPHDKHPSEVSLTHQESSCSASLSIDSSSFTIPAFHNSTDSNTSEQTFGDSDNSLEIEQSYSTTPNEIINGEKEEPVDTQRRKNSHLSGDYVLKSNGLNSEVPAVPLEALEREEDDVLEFQRYLQGHGIKLDLTTVQSSNV